VTRWFTADLHLGHARICALAGRPFGSVKEMNRQLVDRWNSVVQDDDEVWVLGDVAMGAIANTLPMVGDLRGCKHLVLGNHDRPHMAALAGNAALAAEWTAKYLAAGFETVEAGPVALTLAGDIQVLASHFPHEGDSVPEERFASCRPVNDGRWLLCGHVHEAWRVFGRQVNVGVDVWGFSPVSEGAVLDAIKAARAVAEDRVS
jgi:calcineurin-like phosphoesterase family protein